MNFKDFSFEINFHQKLKSSNSRTLSTDQNKFLILINRDIYLYEFYSKNREKIILDQKILQLNTEETLVQATIVQNNIVISTNKRVLHFNLDKDFNCETIFIRENLADYGATIADGKIYYIKSDFEVGIYNLADKKKFSVKHKQQNSITQLNFSHFLNSTSNYITIDSKDNKELYFISTKTQKIFQKETLSNNYYSYISKNDYFILFYLNEFIFKIGFKIGIVFENNIMVNENVFSDENQGVISQDDKVFFPYLRQS